MKQLEQGYDSEVSEGRGKSIVQSLGLWWRLEVGKKDHRLSHLLNQ